MSQRVFLTPGSQNRREVHFSVYKQSPQVGLQTGDEKFFLLSFNVMDGYPAVYIPLHTFALGPALIMYRARQINASQEMERN